MAVEPTRTSRDVDPVSRTSLLGHYQRPHEREFTAEERRTTTILFGNLTPKHEAFLEAVLGRSGLRVRRLPPPNKEAYRLGMRYCSNGLCNPTYYTAGTLIKYLLDLEATGLSRKQIIDDYAYLTASDCGPCRFGMYESEYRLALQNAGFEGFRVLTTQLNKASRSGGHRPGLTFSADTTLDLVNTVILGDLLYQVAYMMRPYEIRAGATDEAIEDCVNMLKEFLGRHDFFELSEDVPRWMYRAIFRRTALANLVNWIGKYHRHFHSKEYEEVLRRCAERLDEVELDRTRAKPIVKIVGEFYSHIAENDANYNMLSFLEEEGAEVCPGSIGHVLQYWFYKSKIGCLKAREAESRPSGLRPATWWRWSQRRRASLKKPLLLTLIDRLYTHQCRRIRKTLGIGGDIVPQRTLARLARPFYDPHTRGGEGHLEVAQAIHYTENHKCHMIVSLKPFGCMPSTQSDGVMAAVTNHHSDMHFVSVETSGDSDIHALSRVHMVLSDARRRARSELEQTAADCGKDLQDVKAYVRANPRLLRRSLSFPHYPGIVSTAANYVAYVSDLMDRDKSATRGAHERR